MLYPHECQYSVKTYRCCTMNCKRYYKTFVYRLHYILTRGGWHNSVLSSTGKLKTKFLTHWKSNKVKLASSAWCPTEFPQEITIGKVQFQNQQQQQYLQQPLSLFFSFFFWRERSLNALLLGQFVSKPDLVAVSCVFIKQGRSYLGQLKKSWKKEKQTWTLKQPQASLYFHDIFL